MEINDELIDKLAHLSRLQFTEEQKQGFKSDFSKMLGFVNKLNELDTTGVEPLLHISENINALRKDEVSQSISRNEALLNAPIHDGVFFKVPTVIKKQESINSKSGS
jgi:aspartyl-tRNA(Asn)/glutamyl-tRNA(Gln) amidotransferase subunit C